LYDFFKGIQQETARSLEKADREPLGSQSMPSLQGCTALVFTGCVLCYPLPMPKEALPRLDSSTKLREIIRTLCRLSPGEIWEDPERNHRVGVLDATNPSQIDFLMRGERALLHVDDPPYNIAVGKKKTEALFQRDCEDYVAFSRDWVREASRSLRDPGHLYVFLGADQERGFQPLPEFMVMMRGFEELRSRSFITLRNQRGYGTQKNWMAVRQELLYYVKGNPSFTVQYTDIPKLLKGYYKVVSGRLTENSARGLGTTIRPGNVWVDIQQVFYRMEENVPGCYAQKPLKAIERIICASTGKGDLVADFFCHAGTTLIAAERLGRRCLTCDIDPVFAEIAIRRLEHFRKTGKTGFQWQSPFPELDLSDLDRHGA